MCLEGEEECIWACELLGGVTHVLSQAPFFSDLIYLAFIYLYSNPASWEIQELPPACQHWPANWDLGSNPPRRGSTQSSLLQMMCCRPGAVV